METPRRIKSNTKYVKKKTVACEAGVKRVRWPGKGRLGRTPSPPPPLTLTVYAYNAD